MAEDTITRALMRKQVCKELRMPFFRRVGSSSVVGAGSSTSSIVDAALTQPDGTWNGSWFFNIDTGEISVIRAFSANDDTFRLENPCAADPIGDAYEIHSIWNADEVHDAINEAVRLGRRTFPETLTDETIVLKEEVLTYNLTSLARTPWIVQKVWVEQRNNCVRGDVVSATSTSVTLPSLPSGINGSWIISIYAGTGAGQFRSVSNPSGASFDVTAWTTIPDVTSKYSLFDASEEITAWRPFNDFHLDAEEYPNTLYMNRLYSSVYGMRIRIEMLSLSPEMTTEASTTNIPREFIKAKACSILHGQALSSTKADKDMHYAEYKRYMDEADGYVVRNATHTPGTRFRTPIDRAHGMYIPRDDPLSWSN